jgi:hypothetical protein
MPRMPLPIFVLGILLFTSPAHADFSSFIWEAISTAPRNSVQHNNSAKSQINKEILLKSLNPGEVLLVWNEDANHKNSGQQSSTLTVFNTVNLTVLHKYGDYITLWEEPKLRKKRLMETAEDYEKWKSEEMKMLHQSLYNEIRDWRKNNQAGYFSATNLDEVDATFYGKTLGEHLPKNMGSMKKDIVYDVDSELLNITITSSKLTDYTLQASMHVSPDKAKITKETLQASSFIITYGYDLEKGYLTPRAIVYQNEGVWETLKRLKVSSHSQYFVFTADEAEKYEMEQEALSIAAKEEAERMKAGQSLNKKLVLGVGALVCGSYTDILKADAIIRSNNPYVEIPYSCFRTIKEAEIEEAKYQGHIAIFYFNSPEGLLRAWTLTNYIF